jgi:excisionase family DNA binding protein
MMPETGRITVDEIATRLALGRFAVYELLNRGEIPAIRLGRRWIVTRYAYEAWERRCGENHLHFEHGHAQAQV